MVRQDCFPLPAKNLGARDPADLTAQVFPFHPQLLYRVLEQVGLHPHHQPGQQPFRQGAANLAVLQARQTFGKFIHKADGFYRSAHLVI